MEAVIIAPTAWMQAQIDVAANELLKISYACDGDSATASVIERIYRVRPSVDYLLLKYEQRVKPFEGLIG